MVKYKPDIMQRLKEAGYSSTTLRREKVFGESVMQAFRSGAVFPNKSLDRLCELLQCQPGDLLEYVPDGGEKIAELGINPGAEGKIGEE